MLFSGVYSFLCVFSQMSIFKTGSRESYRLEVPVSLSELTYWRCNWTTPQKTKVVIQCLLNARFKIYITSFQLFKLCDTWVCCSGCVYSKASSQNVEVSGWHWQFCFNPPWVAWFWQSCAYYDELQSLCLIGYAPNVRWDNQMNSSFWLWPLFCLFLVLSTLREVCAEKQLHLALCAGLFPLWIVSVFEIEAAIINSFEKRKSSGGWVDFFIS